MLRLEVYAKFRLILYNSSRAENITVGNETLFARVVADAFGQRRKTLRNTFKAWLNEADFAALGIDAQLRAENLGVAEFTRIANFVNERVPV